MSTTKTNLDFGTALQTWLDGVKEMSDAMFAEHYQNLTPVGFTTTSGAKFIKVVRSTPEQKDRSVFAFIAICDNETKGLGTVKQGDVMKPATWRAPAKHARGNIYDDHNGLKNVGPYGPAYLL